MFHSRDGLFFKREDNGDVTITKTSDGKEPDAFPGNVLFTQTLEAGSWASAVCDVSVGGEHNLRWYIVMDFHNTDNANGYNIPKMTMADTAYITAKEIGHPFTIAYLSRKMVDSGYRVCSTSAVGVSLGRDSRFENIGGQMWRITSSTTTADSPSGG